MRRLHLAIALSVGLCGSALAAEPTGEWLVKDGTARIRIEPCANALWGVISWTKGEPGTDSQNPDPAKRRRSIIGVPILRSMKQVGPNTWEGEIYDARSGRMYSAQITLVRDDVLTVEGCVLGGIFCDGENWTRVQQTDQTASAPKPPERQAPPARPRGQQQPPPAAAPEVCYGG